MSCLQPGIKPCHALLSLLLLTTALSQTPATPDAPPQTNVTQNAFLNQALSTLFVVGDSAARNQADLGRGDHFAHYFDTQSICTSQVI
jgi:rhamnogalacturonan acetylesterase